MKNDLVERLRDPRRDGPHALLHEAADAIEALTLPTPTREEVAEALAAFVGAAQYDACMEGPVFKGWNRSALDRALAKAKALQLIGKGG